ncbi:calcium-activated chloride channel-domain-containing protein, partial [Thamnocephalis sphaerospora]
LEQRRRGFQAERVVVDNVTGELTPYYPSWKRWLRRLVTVPILAAIGAVFFVVVGAIFGIEVFVYEYYQGPFKGIVHYAPLVAYSVAIWYFGDAYTAIAKWLNRFENYETDAEHNRHYTYKIFLINFAVGYMFIFYTAWIHIPFNEEIANLLAQWTGWPIKPQPAGVEKLQERVIYYVLTAQVINFFTEVAVPWLLRGATTSAKKVQNAVTHKAKQEQEDVDESDRKFLKRITKEDELADYELYEDYAEMVTQFGHVVLFSCAWPLAPLLSFINNWVELRSDAFKICVHTKRQVPARVESIGPWIDNLLFLSWLSSVANALLVYQFRPHETTEHLHHTLYWPLLLVILAEHLYLASRWLLRAVLKDVPSWAVTLGRQQEHELKCRWLKKMHVDVPVPSSPRTAASAEETAANQVDDRGTREIANAFKNI